MMMSLGRWVLISVVWVLLIGGGLVLASWVETGIVRLPRTDEISVSAMAACFRERNLEPPSFDVEVGETVNVPSDITPCAYRKNRAEVVFFYSSVFGPPLLLGLISLLWSVMRGRGRAA